MAGAAALQDLLGHLLGFINRNCKAQAGPGGLADGGVNANHLTPVINQRATAVAWVHSGIGLDVSHPLPAAQGVVAGNRTHDSHRHRVVEPQGVTDGDGPLTGPDIR